MLSTQTYTSKHSSGTRPATRVAVDPDRAEQAADDQRLLDGLLADDEKAWREFNERYSRLIYRCITRVTARFRAVVGPEDIREIYAMLCVQLLANDKKKLRTFEVGRGNKLSSWIGMLAVHSAYDYLRSIKREPNRGCMSEAESLTSDTPDPYDIFLLRQRGSIVASLLEGFSRKDREFIQLYYGEGLEPDRVAELMGISVKTVYSKKHKIRSRLEAMLQERRLAA